ncbi:MAG: DUF2064 domain-containing protein [Phaeodactylibacter sp.]|nr:DUF2064 domain-containing protein [Phaeodactylibacter sp.]
MNVNTHSTALLFFVRDEREEARLKPLGNDTGISTVVIRKLNEHIHREATLTGLPFFTIKGNEQVGQTFGERLSNAYQSVFDKGFERVIAIGNDCPELNASLMLQAAKQLEGQSVVLGPTEDGGAYLIGVQRAAFRKEQFSKLPWQTAKVYSSLLNWAGGEVAVLNASFDIDGKEALRAKLARLPFLLRRLITALIRQSNTPHLVRRSIWIATGVHRLVGLRAPPHIHV